MNKTLKYSAIIATLALTGCGSDMTVMKPMDDMKEMAGKTVERTSFKMSEANLKKYRDIETEANKVSGLVSTYIGDKIPTSSDFPTDLKYFGTDSVKAAFDTYVKEVEAAKKIAETKYNQKLQELTAAKKLADEDLASKKVSYDEAYAPIKKIKEELAALELLQNQSNEKIRGYSQDMITSMNTVIVEQKLPVRKLSRGMDRFSYWEQACTETGITKDRYRTSYMMNHKDLCVEIKLPFKNDVVDSFVNNENVIESIKKNLPLMVDEYLVQGALKLKKQETNGYSQQIKELELEKRNSGIVFENAYGKSERYATREVNNLINKAERQEKTLNSFVEGKDGYISYETGRAFDGNDEVSAVRNAVEKEKINLSKSLLTDYKVEKDVPFETFDVAVDESNPYFVVIEKFTHDGKEGALIFSFKTTSMVDLSDSVKQDGNILMDKIKREDYFSMNTMMYPKQDEMILRGINTADRLMR